MSAARAHWLRGRSRLRAIANALRRDDLDTAAALLFEAECDAFGAGRDRLAGECAAARRLVAGGDTLGGAELVQRLLEWYEAGS